MTNNEKPFVFVLRLSIFLFQSNFKRTDGAIVIRRNQTNVFVFSFHLDRPKSGDLHFFEMMGPILRMKYHVDPSSLSCILEFFFNHIYSTIDFQVFDS